VALILLVLFLHAALAGASHFHRLGRGLAAPASRDAAVRNAEAQSAPESSAHAECLLCRLQRDLASGLRNAGSATVEPPSAPLTLEAASPDACPATLRGVARGRAPPNA
jgi:hypothetical protein